MILNGWQRIKRVDGNSLPSFGTQLTFKPNSKITLNSSTFIGTDKPDSARQMRYFHNFYGIFQLSERVGLTLGFDYGIEEKSPESASTNKWFSPVVIAKFQVNNKLSISARAEYYEDRHGVIIATGSPNGFRTSGASANVDFLILPNVVWRMEVRDFSSKDKIFAKAEGFTKTNTFVTTSLAISL